MNVSRPVRCPTFWVVILAAVVATDRRASSSDAPCPLGVLVDAPVDVGRAGEAYSGVILPARSGAYDFRVGYPLPAAEVDAKASGPRRFAQPRHEAYGGKLRVEVVEAGSGRRLEAREPQWTPTETVSSGGREACGDVLRFDLRNGVAYEVRLAVEVVAPALRSFRPRFVIEASDGVRMEMIADQWRSTARGALSVFGASTLVGAGALGLWAVFRARPSERAAGA